MKVSTSSRGYLLTLLILHTYKPHNVSEGLNTVYVQQLIDSIITIVSALCPIHKIPGRC